MTNASIFAFVAAMLGGAMALGVLWQERRSAAHIAFALGMLTLATQSLFVCFSFNTMLPENVIQWERYKMVASSLLPSLWLFFSLTYARGNYREFISRWRIALWVSLLLPLGIAVGFMNSLVMPVQVTESKWALALTLPGVVLTLIMLLSYVLVLMNLERTFRASVGTMRWRIKFMIIGLGLLFLARAYTKSQVLLFHRVDPTLDLVDSIALVVACLLILRSLLRAGNFDVNVYPSHSVIHRSLILLLAGVYLLIVGLAAKVVNILGAHTSFPVEAFILLVGLVSLTVLLLSERVQLSVKRFVSRHFQRPIYDYRTVWRRFTECTASRMDQVELSRATVKLVAEIFQVLSVTVWLVDESKKKLLFVASTSLSDAKGEELSLTAAESLEVLRALEKHPDPVDIESSTESWAAALRRSNPDTFNQGGSRICVPMIVSGEVLGVMTIGDRVGEIPFMHQDLDLLKCVGDQAAASLRNLQLSGKLLQVKEMEAFQTMSAFFVHDLKNTASTLGLMLKNLPIHFNDPAFREDALRGVAKTVNHINSLIGRLSMLRHGLEIKPSEADLNELVEKGLAAHKGALTMELVKELQPLPKVSFDPEQVMKVFTNLVINASEAMPKQQGQMRIQTSQTNGWAVLAVADNGCGMSPEFLSRSLFRPFQTTKKAGLGIGMFQSKMIVEAHGGRIEVESEPGKGSTFRILLPLQKEK